MNKETYIHFWIIMRPLFELYNLNGCLWLENNRLMSNKISWRFEENCMSAIISFQCTFFMITNAIQCKKIIEYFIILLHVGFVNILTAVLCSTSRVIFSSTKGTCVRVNMGSHVGRTGFCVLPKRNFLSPSIRLSFTSVLVWNSAFPFVPIIRLC